MQADGSIHSLCGRNVQCTVIGTVTIFASGASFIVTAVAALALLTPVIVSNATVLSAFESVAVANNSGNIPMEYGGVPPLMDTV
jgi:hypothetical protein